MNRWWWRFVERGYVHAATACWLRFQKTKQNKQTKKKTERRRTESYQCTVWAKLILWELVGLQVFLKSFVRIMFSQSNGWTVPKFGCSTGKCSDSKVCCCCCCFLGRDWACKDKTGWMTAVDALWLQSVLLLLLFPGSRLGMQRQDWVADPVDALEGSEVLVPEGTGGLCHSGSCTQATGFCSQYAVQQVSSVAQGEWEWFDLTS